MIERTSVSKSTTSFPELTLVRMARKAAEQRRPSVTHRDGVRESGWMCLQPMYGQSCHDPLPAGGDGR